MKKDKLIGLLQKIEGNPDIYLWNGFVGDWADIDPNFVNQLLVKESVEHKYKCLIYEWMRDNNSINPPPFSVEDRLRTLAKAQFAKQQWDLPNPYCYVEEYPEWYGKHKKNIVIINHKQRGKTHSDRVGDMCY